LINCLINLQQKKILLKPLEILYTGLKLYNIKTTIWYRTAISFSQFFLKLNQLKVLLVGAIPVGLEKLSAMLNNAPHTFIKIIA
jgi:hypothetical protein